MKCLLLFPPQWIPFNPHLAGPAIHSILKNNGHDVRLHDLNAEFYNMVLTPKFLYEAVKAAFADFEANAQNVFQACPDKADLKSHPQEFQLRYRRYREIFRMAQKNEYRNVIKRIEWAVGVLRDKDAFYDPATVDDALAVINTACGMLSATHHPSGVYFLNPNVNIYYNVETLRQACENIQGNIFHSFYEPLIAGLLKDQPEFIGISLGDYSQLLPGLTLAMLLKKATSAHVCIGGNLFGRYTDVIINNPDFFSTFADSVIFNEGEKPVIELLKHLDGKVGIESVPNLMYVDGGRIVVNEEAQPYSIGALFPADFSDLPAKNYFVPEPIFNIQASRSCYWRKCSFCTHHFGSRYAIKPVAQTIAEIKSLQEKQGARFFHFIDEAISPAYLERLSQAIIKEGLDINFFIYGRFEHTFDQKLFKLAYRAGLRMVLWGFESANERIYRLMNKGELADKGKRLKILEAAHAEGVWNFLFLMFGFPTETLEEAKETVDFVRDHRHMLSHGTGSTFMLLEGSPILNDMDKYAITDIQKIRNGFSFAHRFKTSRGTTPEEKKELDSYKAINWNLSDMKYLKSSFREKLFLYVCRYGVRQVSEMNKDIWL
jgi:anaerobic magnesium-protoporphyrin IX monomethyl ester cyclase